MLDGLSRRTFLKLAATAGAAATIPACEPAARHIVPYVIPDEYVIPGVPTYYATICNECSASCGVIAKIREGRVIKLEGNPNDPISQGAICARGQAALQGVYNPDRLGKPMRRAVDGSLHEISWDDALKIFNERLAAAAKAGKDRVAFIGSSQGPTLDNVTQKWAQAFGSTRVAFWEPINQEAARVAAEACFGTRNLPVYRLDQADVIVSFGADYLETWGSPVEQTRQYAEFRTPRTAKDGVTIGKSVFVNPRMGLTGGKSDLWIASNPGTEGEIAMAVLNVVASQGWLAKDAGVDAEAVNKYAAAFDPESVSQRSGVSVDQIKLLATWIGQADNGLVLTGTDDPQAHIAAYLLNALTGSIGKTMAFLQGGPTEAATPPQEVHAIVRAISTGEVDVVVAAGGANPVFTMPPQWGADAAIKGAPFVVWMGDCTDETAQAAHLLIPTHHPLETWRDSAPRAGVYGLGQPVMQPVFPSRPLHDILITSAHLGAGPAAQSITWENAQDAINSAWQDLQSKIAASSNANDFWEHALRSGGIFQEAKSSRVALKPDVFRESATPRVQAAGEYTLVGFPHIFFYDGRGANKPWLQEIPEPTNQIVWDGWVDVHPDTAAKLGLTTYQTSYLYAGINVLEIATPVGRMELTAHVTPLVKPGVFAAPIGQGHTAYGRYANGRGPNLWKFLPEGSRSVPVTVRVTEKEYKLVTPMGKSDQMGRSIIEAMSVQELAAGKQPEIVHEEELETPKVPYEMYPPWKYPGHKWGMTIDVNSCTGCSACVAACYAENNLPVGGKEQVDKGRVMSWLRIERFIPTADEAPKAPNLYIAPILCQQCDHAPCEPVCPVFASHHTPEGLNAQIYNRCVGTRFCENNCPYKVRRFNWYLPTWAEPLNLQLNPDVTVRGAGVMEKCTFCIQRITTAEINARTENRQLVDGEIITACAQACPSRAISFGDLNNPDSAMVKRRLVNNERAHNKGRTYTMLPEFNALPAITYLRSLYWEKA